jgi:hypothetical protein
MPPRRRTIGSKIYYFLFQYPNGSNIQSGLDFDPVTEFAGFMLLPPKWRPSTNDTVRRDLKDPVISFMHETICLTVPAVAYGQYISIRR